MALEPVPLSVTVTVQVFDEHLRRATVTPHAASVVTPGVAAAGATAGGLLGGIGAHPARTPVVRAIQIPVFELMAVLSS